MITELIAKVNDLTTEFVLIGRVIFFPIFVKLSSPNFKPVHLKKKRVLGLNT